MAVDLLPDGPDPANDTPQAFSQKAAAMVLAQKAMIPQFNNSLAQFNAAIAGGAYALPYVFDTEVSDADPGSGKLRLSNATQNTSTVLRLDILAGGQDVASILDKFDASTSDIKGSIRIVKAGDASKWLTFDVMSRAAPSGYRNFAVTNTGASSTRPFTNGDSVVLHFTRNGDKGAGIPHCALLAAVDVTTPVTVVNLLNIFTSDYEKYLIELSGFVFTTSVIPGSLALQLADASGVNTGNLYTAASGATAYAKSTPDTSIGINSATSTALSCSIELRNANAPSNPSRAGEASKTIGIRGFCLDASAATTATRYAPIQTEGLFLGPGAVNGLRLSLGGLQSITAGKIRVFGFRNSLI